MADTQFSRLLKETLDDRMGTQSELAESLDYSQGYVSKILSGRKDPSQEFVLRLAKNWSYPKRTCLPS